MTKFLSFLLTLSFLLIAGQSHAGQALRINSSGSRLVWDKSAADPIVLHPEDGACGQFTNSQMLALMEANLAYWNDVATLDMGFTIETGTLGMVDGCNYDDFLAGVLGETTSQSNANAQDGINPIIFDNDGEIIETALGENNGRYTILGFTTVFSDQGTDFASANSVVDAQEVYNCYCLEGTDGTAAHSDCDDNGVLLTTDDLNTTMVHELGHFLNLDHSQVNLDFATSTVDAELDNVPLMFPYATSAFQISPTEDDIVAGSSLYPSSNFFTAGDVSSTYCKVTGALIDSYGADLRCADVQAIADDRFYDVSFTSGAYAIATDSNSDEDTVDTGECTSGCGDFELYLIPGTDYYMQIKNIYSGFTGGSGIHPCVNSQITRCTDALLAKCTDGDSSTDCTACIKNETVTSSSIFPGTDSTNTIAAGIAANCTAGNTVELGTITTSSVSPASAADSSITLVKPASMSFDMSLDSNNLLRSEVSALSRTLTCEESGLAPSSGGSSGCSLNTQAIGNTSCSLSAIALLLVLGMVRAVAVTSKTSSHDNS